MPDDPGRSAAVTQMLEAVSAGDAHAASQLLEAVYEKLRRLAAAKIAREQPGMSIQATALVHEAYIRLVGDRNAEWNGRGHFFGAAAEAMRRILVEQARARNAAKRGGGERAVGLHDSMIAVRGDTVDLVALSDALERLHRESPEKATLVKLRYFTGMTIPQAAEALEISHATAERWWAYSRLLLYQWLNEPESGKS